MPHPVRYLCLKKNKLGWAIVPGRSMLHTGPSIRTWWMWPGWAAGHIRLKCFLSYWNWAVNFSRSWVSVLGWFQAIFWEGSWPHSLCSSVWGDRVASVQVLNTIHAQLPREGVKIQLSVVCESLFHRYHEPQGHCTCFSSCLDSLHSAIATTGPFIHSFLLCAKHYTGCSGYRRGWQ